MVLTLKVGDLTCELFLTGTGNDEHQSGVNVAEGCHPRITVLSRKTHGADFLHRGARYKNMINRLLTTAFTLLLFAFPKSIVAQESFDLLIQLRPTLLGLKQSASSTPSTKFLNRFKDFHNIEYCFEECRVDLKNLLDSDLRLHVSQIEVQHCESRKGMFTGLEKLENLEAIVIHYGTEEMLIENEKDIVEAIMKLPKLSHFRVRGLKISRELFEALAKSKSLNSLHIPGSEFADDDLKSFTSERPDVKVISVWATLGP